MQVWWLFTIMFFFDFLSVCRFVQCTFGINMFFLVYAGLVNLKSQTYIFATFERYDFSQKHPRCLGSRLVGYRE